MARARVLFPAPRSPRSASTSGGRAPAPTCRPQASSAASSSTASILAPRPGAAGGGAAALRARRGAVHLRLQLQVLVAQERRALEVQLRGRVAHLALDLLQHLLRRQLAERRPPLRHLRRPVPL